MPRVRGPHCFTPINEITFWGYCGGEWGWVAPFGKDRETRHRFRRVLCEAAIAGVRAIRAVDPEARMVHTEPLIQVVPPPDRPDLADEAAHEAVDDAFFAWDVLAGRRHPELGGAPEILDVVGANCYSFGHGLLDVVDEGGALRRVPSAPCVAELRRWQRELNRVTALDDDPFSDPVELQDVGRRGAAAAAARGPRLVVRRAAGA